MSENSLIYVGLTRESAPLALRERVSASVEPSADVYRELRGLAPERLLLSTCERFEVYACGHTAASSGMLRWLASACGVGVDELARHALVLTGLPVAEQMLRVASGLRSRVAGETQILTQMRHAFRASDRYGGAGPILHCLARSAIHTGRRVRREKAINHTNRSVATVAIEYLSSQFVSLAEKSILVIGTGRLASDICRRLAGHRLRRLVVASRSESRAAVFARPFGGFGVALSGMDGAIRECEAVIACSKVAGPVLGLGHIGRRAGSELSILDLGMPRNVDGAVGLQPGVRFNSLDDILDRENAACLFPDADRIVLEELNRFARWFNARSVAPSIARSVELRRGGRGGGGSASAVSRALHREIMRIKAGVAA